MVYRPMESAGVLISDPNRLIGSTVVASITLVVYDYVCTLDEEIAHVWSNPWNIASILFFLNRYLPFIDTTLSLTLKHSFNTPEACLNRFTAVTWLIVIGIILSEVILMLRIYAIWKRKRWVLWLLCGIAIVVFPGAISIAALEIRSLRYIASPLPGCQLSHASPIIIVAYILLLLSETAMAVLTAVRVYQHRTRITARWIFQLYQDGFIFYACLLTISLANVVIPIVAPPVFANWLATPQRVMHSVLCTRMILLILRQRSIRIDPRLPVSLQDGGGQRSSAPVFTSVIEPDVGLNFLTMPGNENHTPHSESSGSRSNSEV